MGNSKGGVQLPLFSQALQMILIQADIWGALVYSPAQWTEHQETLVLILDPEVPGSVTLGKSGLLPGLPSL